MNFRKLFVVFSSIALLALVSDTAFAPPGSTPKPYVTISISPNPAPAGTSVDITVSAQYSSTDTTPVTVGKLQVWECQDSGGNPLPSSACEVAPTTGTWVQIGQSADPNGTGSYTVAFDTTGLGGKSIGFYGAFAPGSSAGGTWAANQSPSANLVVTAVCTGDLEFAVTMASISSNPASNNEPITWSYTVTATACVDLQDIKVQGGTNGWANPVTSSDVTASTGTVVVKANKKNQVITWTIDTLLQGQTATLTVNGSGTAKADTGMCSSDPTYLTPRYLNGAWSAVYTETDTGITSKSDYSTPLFVDVLCY